MKTGFFQKIRGPLEYWFWRAQVSALCACPPLQGIVMNLNMSPRQHWFLTILRIALKTPAALCRHCRDKLKKRVVLGRVSFGITTRCTLNCDKCAGFLPDFELHEDTPADELIQDIRTLVSCADYIYTLNLTGGEPFLHPELDQIIRTCAESDQIGAVDLSTNGTIIPGAPVLTALREAKIVVRISRYAPILQPNVEQLKAILKENGIRYLHELGDYWYDTGGTELLPGSAKRKFSLCANKLNLPLYNGVCHLCTKSMYLMKTGVIPDCQEEYIDVRNIDPAKFCVQWKQLRKRRVITACSYCQGFSFETPRVPAAAQRGPRGAGEETDYMKSSGKIDQLE
ncbi:MAG: radical SAM protein [Oscillospiraceae bacterium]|nr:radical SAM protein [Oscillospiraceae bacterium]